MFKRILLAIVQFVVFLALLQVGGNWDAINLGWEMRQLQAGHTPHVLFPTLKTQISASHTLIANGLLYAGVLMLIILGVQAARRRLRPAALYSVGAFLLAVLVALSLKMGLPPSS
jgi:hypothetical protein